MRYALCLALALVACKTKEAAPTAAGSAASAASAGSAARSGASGSGAGADTPAAGPGVSIASSVNPEVAGGYAKAFAKLANADEPTTIVFVRGCPALACTDNVFEIESIAQKCPKAFTATATIPDKDPKPGHLMSDLLVAGPAEKAATITLKDVALEVTDLGPDGIAGSAVQSTTESKVSGAFKAEICGRM